MLGLIPFTGFAAFLAVYGPDIGLDETAPVFFAYAGTVLAIRIFGAKLPDRLGWRRASSIALTAVGAGALVLAVWASVAAVWIAAGCLAVGMSLLYPALFSAALEDVPDHERSQAVGTFSLFFDLSQGIGAPLLGVVVALSGERAAFLVAALIAGAGFWAQHRLRRAHAAADAAAAAASARDLACAARRSGRGRAPIAPPRCGGRSRPASTGGACPRTPCEPRPPAPRRPGARARAVSVASQNRSSMRWAAERHADLVDRVAGSHQHLAPARWSRPRAGERAEGDPAGELVPLRRHQREALVVGVEHEHPGRELEPARHRQVQQRDLARLETGDRAVEATALGPERAEVPSPGRDDLGGLGRVADRHAVGLLPELPEALDRARRRDARRR